ncbi:MAG: DUF2069 domain-containing protein [Chromatiales bacterium]|nr:DUF2069 domain-containing protein [Chromatiales bacterium]
MVSLASYLTLLSVLVLWNALIEPPEKIPRVLPILALGLPLLMVLRGLLHARRRSCQLSTLLALVYFSLGLIDIAGGALLYGWLQTIAATLWFVSLLVYLKQTANKVV